MKGRNILFGNCLSNMTLKNYKQPIDARYFLITQYIKTQVKYLSILFGISTLFWFGILLFCLHFLLLLEDICVLDSK